MLFPWGHRSCPHLQSTHQCTVPCTTWPSASFPTRTAAEHNSHHLCLGAHTLESLHAVLFSQPPMCCPPGRAGPSHGHHGSAKRWVLAAALPALHSATFCSSLSTLESRNQHGNIAGISQRLFVHNSCRGRPCCVDKDHCIVAPAGFGPIAIPYSRLSCLITSSPTKRRQGGAF